MVKKKKKVKTFIDNGNENEYSDQCRRSLGNLPSTWAYQTTSLYDKSMSPRCRIQKLNKSVAAHKVFLFHIIKVFILPPNLELP